MISSIIEQWENNKSKLENYFRTTDQYEYCAYKQIVEKLFELCITNADQHSGFNIERMTVIDDGDYQGTKLFIIPTSLNKNLAASLKNDKVMHSLIDCRIGISVLMILYNLNIQMNMILLPLLKISSCGI